MSCSSRVLVLTMELQTFYGSINQRRVERANEETPRVGQLSWLPLLLWCLGARKEKYLNKKFIPLFYMCLMSSYCQIKEIDC